MKSFRFCYKNFAICFDFQKETYIKNRFTSMNVHLPIRNMGWTSTAWCQVVAPRRSDTIPYHSWRWLCWQCRQFSVLSLWCCCCSSSKYLYSWVDLCQQLLHPRPTSHCSMATGLGTPWGTTSSTRTWFRVQRILERYTRWQTGPPGLETSTLWGYIWIKQKPKVTVVLFISLLLLFCIGFKNQHNLCLKNGVQTLMYRSTVKATVVNVDPRDTEIDFYKPKIAL